MGERMWRRTVTELSSYPTELDAHVTLTDQRRVRIRALHSREERPIRVLRVRLSPPTRYLRFLSPIPSLPDALVCVAPSTDGEVPLTPASVNGEEHKWCSVCTVLDQRRQSYEFSRCSE